MTRFFGILFHLTAFLGFLRVAKWGVSIFKRCRPAVSNFTLREVAEIAGWLKALRRLAS